MNTSSGIRIMSPARILLGFLAMLFTGQLFGQTQWDKYPHNPVMAKDTTLANTWEWAAIGQPTCLVENDTFKMWYVAAGVPSFADTVFRGRICYAYSLDGINWVKHGPPVLDVGRPGDWDSQWLDTPAILRDATGYKLYYLGDSVWMEQPPVSSAIGLATSTDGIHWQKSELNPVLQKGDRLSWDGFWIESPAVLYDVDDHTYKMWYTGVALDWKIRIGYATSPDGLVWTKQLQNPVLDVGQPGAWDDLWAAVPAVRKIGNRFEMWYAGVSVADYLMNNNFDTIRVGYAYSFNGMDWTRHALNPILSTFDPPIDNGGPWAPDVVFDGSKYRMWYETAAGFGLAVSAPLNSIDQIQIPLHQFHLEQNYPNPFNQSTVISYQLPVSSQVELSIYNLLGQKIVTLVSEQQSAGIHKLNWDARGLASGVYLYRLEAGDPSTGSGQGFVQTKKLILIR